MKEAVAKAVAKAAGVKEEAVAKVVVHSAVVTAVVVHSAAVAVEDRDYHHFAICTALKGTSRKNQSADRH